MSGHDILKPKRDFKTVNYGALTSSRVEGTIGGSSCLNPQRKRPI